MTQSPLSGPHYFILGLTMLTRPGIRRWVILPVCINILIFALLGGIGWHYFAAFNHWFIAHTPDWLHWLTPLFSGVYLLIFLIISAYFFTWLANLIAAPFYAWLSEVIQRKHSNKPLPNKTWREILASMPGAVMRQVRIIGYYLLRAIIVLLITLIPGVNLFAGILWFLFGAWMLTMQNIDYVCDNNDIDFYAMRQWMKNHWQHSMSFGAVVLFGMMIPVVNIIVLPAAVIGATLMVLHNQ